MGLTATAPTAVGMAGELAFGLLRLGRVPAANDLVGAGGEDVFAVGADGGRGHGVGMRQDARRGDGQGPEFEQAVAAAREQLIPGAR